MENKEWLVLNYTLPREPSRLRVNIWRKLKKNGAITVGQSMWILPSTDETLKVFTEIMNEIESNNYEVYIMKSTFIQDKNSEKVIELFNTSSNAEYKEFLEKCEDFIKEIEKETSKNNFSFAEIEENEHELNKLNIWYNKITSRDFFEAALKEQSGLMLSKCKDVLESFSNKVYECNDTL